MKKKFSATLVIILLVIYTVVMIDILIQLLFYDVYEPPSEKVVSMITAIGGLVSAYVVAKLTDSSPGDIPKFAESGKAEGVEKVIMVSYLVIWGLVGLACFVTGTFIEEKEHLVNDIGTTWFGIAVAAAYAYLGINPNQGN